LNLTDTHCHLDFNKFDEDRPEVLERAARAGVVRILIPGLSVTSSQTAVKLAESHPMLYAAVGVHPSEAMTWNAQTIPALRNLVFPHSNPSPREAPPKGAGRGAAGEGKIVAIGEIGLDYYWDSAPHGLQMQVLKEQLDLAGELQLPVIIHFREKSDAPDGDCASDLMKILEEWVAGMRSRKSPLAEQAGVLHSFSGTLETAQAAMRLGFFIGVTGPVTYRKERQELVAALPLKRLLIETDAPFLIPSPHPLSSRSTPEGGRERGAGVRARNEPAYIRLIADKIALLHSCNIEEVATVTSENAQRLFAWKEIA
jgi:TatD DNase family protein